MVVVNGKMEYFITLGLDGIEKNENGFFETTVTQTVTSDMAPKCKFMFFVPNYFGKETIVETTEIKVRLKRISSMLSLFPPDRSKTS